MLNAGATADVFTCPRHAGDLTLTPPACAQMWTRAHKKTVEAWETIAVCRGCEVGARHAGVAELPRQNVDDLPGIGGHCARCLRWAPRLIYQTLCVSCANRQLELKRGRNRKGSRPTLQLAKVRVDILLADKVTAVSANFFAQHPLEAAITPLRRVDGSQFILRHPGTGWLQASNVSVELGAIRVVSLGRARS